MARKMPERKSKRGLQNLNLPDNKTYHKTINKKGYPEKWMDQWYIIIHPEIEQNRYVSVKNKSCQEIDKKGVFDKLRLNISVAIRKKNRSIFIPHIIILNKWYA